MIRLDESMMTPFAIDSFWILLGQISQLHISLLRIVGLRFLLAWRQLLSVRPKILISVCKFAGNLQAYLYCCMFEGKSKRNMMSIHLLDCAFERRIVLHGWITFQPRCPRHQGSRSSPRVWVMKAWKITSKRWRGCESISSISTTWATT